MNFAVSLLVDSIMKIYLTILFVFLVGSAHAQADTAMLSPWQTAYHPHTTVATLSLGFIDGFKTNYTLPVGYEHSSTSGFAPLLLKVEYGITKNLGIAASFGYDAVVYNYNQLYQGYNGTIRRYKMNKLKVVSGGFTAFYHFNKLINSRNLDPFIGGGFALNNIRYSAFPQGDSIIPRNEHTISPYIKVGARYYISSSYSVFADLGYEKSSIFSVGFSCRFANKHRL